MAIGQIEVLEVGHIVHILNLLAQFSAKLPLLADALQYGLAALVELLEAEQQVAYGGNLHLVERARGLFAIAGYEGHRGALFEKFDGFLHLSLVEFQSVGYNRGIIHRLQR